MPAAAMAVLVRKKTSIPHHLPVGLVHSATVTVTSCGAFGISMRMPPRFARKVNVRSGYCEKPDHQDRLSGSRRRRNGNGTDHPQRTGPGREAPDFRTTAPV